jgi:hypothetical protein
MAAERARLEDWRKGKQRILLGRGVLVLAERGITYARQQTLSLQHGRSWVGVALT